MGVADYKPSTGPVHYSCVSKLVQQAIHAHSSSADHRCQIPLGYGYLDLDAFFDVIAMPVDKSAIAGHDFYSPRSTIAITGPPPCGP